jgi:hypothetical protein
MCFDRATGLLYIADVGQNQWEEIERRSRHAGARVNYGWNIMEGAHCFRSQSCAREGLTLPVLEYGHDQGCSITGGLVYRGKKLPDVVGCYFYSDYCSGWVRSFRYANGTATDLKEWRLPRTEAACTSFGGRCGRRNCTFFTRTGARAASSRRLVPPRRK